MPPSQIGRYQVIDRIGQGGMGSVYLARDPEIDRLVAIKLLKEEFDEDQRRRFKQEALLAGKLPHVNIVTIFDVGDHEGRPFIAMSYIPGETLAQLIQRRAPLSLVRKLRVVEELCSGLQSAHNEGIVHRDIKPANVMVDPSGVVKILDFGIARLLSEGTLKTQDGTIIGSYNYMSPEQLTGKPLDHRSDIFAVGALLYELISYTRAFKGTVGDGLLYRVVHEPPPPLRELCADIDEDLERIVVRALEKDPANRYRDIEGMRRDLTRVKLRAIATELRPLLKEAEEDIRAGHFEAALAKAQEALTVAPDEPRALDLVESARKGLDERQIRALLDGARDDLSRRALELAAAQISAALNIDPRSSEALTLSAELRERTQEEKRVEKAIALADECVASRDYDGALAKLTGFEHPLVATKKVEIEALAARRRDALVRIDRARKSIHDRDFDAAIALLSEAEQLVPGDPAVTVLMTEAREGQQRREQEDAARRLARDDLEQVRALQHTGKHKEALKHLDARLSQIPQEWDDLWEETAALREEVEDAFTKQVIEVERARQAAVLLAEARASDSYDAALPLLRKVLEMYPDHAEAQQLLTARAAARETERVRLEQRHRIAEARNRIEAALARNDIARAERELIEAERQFQAPDAFAAVRHRLDELRRIAAPTSPGLPKGPASEPAAEVEDEPTLVIQSPFTVSGPSAVEDEPTVVIRPPSTISARSTRVRNVIWMVAAASALFWALGMIRC